MNQQPSFQPIADLHCDLLLYLSGDPKRTPYDPVVRCSIPQLKEGNVKFQTMAIFSETTPGSAKNGLAQVDSLLNLLKNHSDVFELVRQPDQFKTLPSSNKIGILPAIENASVICEENEDLENALKRFTTIQHKIGKVIYLSLTWNTENRFGGGAHTDLGLKEDGKRMIDYLHQKKIALDLSHASDRLAFDVLNHIDKNDIKIKVIASHSNFRSVTDVPRNLPDDLAKEIIKRDGIIGMNFIRLFVGDSEANFTRQLEHALKLGFHKGICFGADFFFTEDLSPAHRKPVDQYFFPSIEHAGRYPEVIKLWNINPFQSSGLLTDICYNNLAKWVFTP